MTGFEHKKNRGCDVDEEKFAGMEESVGAWSEAVEAEFGELIAQEGDGHGE